MSDDIKCTHCGKKNPLDQWFITTAYALGVEIDQVVSSTSPVKLYFCPCCGLPNSVTKPKSQENQRDETSEENSDQNEENESQKSIPEETVEKDSI
jgi:ribosomal protein S26